MTTSRALKMFVCLVTSVWLISATEVSAHTIQSCLDTGKHPRCLCEGSGIFGCSLNVNVKFPPAGTPGSSALVTVCDQLCGHGKTCYAKCD